jgi:3-phenylpropionate/trans-cinnamate dioxygenase ferredoxin subunit
MSEATGERGDGYQYALRTNDIPAGEGRRVQIDGNDILVCHSAGAFHAVKNLCTHAESKLEGGRIRANWISCPAHGARFDLASGKSLGSVGYRSLTTYPIKIEGDEIFLLV